jgi:parallel beta-helix repeat protein
VTFLDGATAIGSASLSSGQATFVTSTLTAGTHSVTAAYGATVSFSASTSGPVTETVSPANVLYVDRANPSCTNNGAKAGTSATPFCTISAAASKATAGVTVLVSAGTYGESVTVGGSGTSAAPITFTAAGGATVTVTGGTSGFTLSNRSWVVIHGFNVTQTTSTGISVSGGSNVTIDGNHVSLAGLPQNNKTAVGIKLSSVTQSVVSNNTTDHNSDAGIYVTGSNNNTIRNNTSFSNARGYTRAAAGIDVRTGGGNQVYANVTHDNEDSGINAWTGTTNGTNFFYDNVVYANGDHGIDVHNAQNDRVVANTVYGNYDSGIEITTSTGTLLANNVSVDNGINSTRTSGDIRVDSTSAPTTTVNDDLVFLRVTGVMIDWNGVKYSSLVSFRTATGQESRGLQADPRFVAAASANFHLMTGSPAVDSANSGAPGQPATDFDGAARFDDPGTVNTGIGPVGYADRGAFELHP